MCYYLRTNTNIWTLRDLVSSVPQWAEVKMGEKCLAPPNKWKAYACLEHLRPAHREEKSLKAEILKLYLIPGVKYETACNKLGEFSCPIGKLKGSGRFKRSKNLLPALTSRRRIKR